MEASEITLGMRVHASDRLFRERKYEMPKGAASYGWTKTWKRAAETLLGAKPIPADGVVVGIRSLHETGISESNGEYIEWSGLSRRTSVLIATDLRRAPVHAWIEDVTPEEGEKNR